jgi:hypothetical protein
MSIPSLCLCAHDYKESIKQRILRDFWCAFETEDLEGFLEIGKRRITNPERIIKGKAFRRMLKGRNVEERGDQQV